MQVDNRLAAIAVPLLCVAAFGLGRSTAAEDEKYASASCGSPEKDGTVTVTIEETRAATNPDNGTRKWPRTVRVPVTAGMLGSSKAAAIAEAINTPPTGMTATANSNVLTITANQDPPGSQGITKVKHDDGDAKEKWSAQILDAVSGGALAPDPSPTTAGWIVMLGEPTGLAPDGVTLSYLEIATDRANVVYAIPQNLVLHDMTRAVVDSLIDHGIAATMITDGVIQFTLSGTLDRRLSVKLTDDGLDVSHWIEAR